MIKVRKYGKVKVGRTETAGKEEQENGLRKELDMKQTKKK